MKHCIRKKDIPYVIAAIILGSVSHFLYDFSEQNPFTALFTPVNESTWEHLKLIFFPVLLLTAVEYYFRRPRKSAFFASRFFGVIMGMLSVIILFYGYSGLLGRNFLIADILIFIIGIVTSYCISGYLYRRLYGLEPMVVFFAWFTMILLFFIFTCFPPDFFLFFPPQQ